mgnify:CR=1 FL=1
MITKSFRMTAVAALLCGVSAMAVAAVTAGTYEGAAQGKLSTVKAAVTLNQDGRITDVKLDVSGETPELGGAAAKKMAPAIVEHQSTAVDGMSGATGVIYRAFTNRLGGFKMQSEAELIQAIYAECSKLEPKYADMQNLTASKYGIKNSSMAYFNANSGGVQTAVYSRLHVNEPADALVMRYTHSDPDIPEGEYTLLYNNLSLIHI